MHRHRTCAAGTVTQIHYPLGYVLVVIGVCRHVGDYSDNVVNPKPSNINDVMWYTLSYDVIGQHELAWCCPELLLYERAMLTRRCE